MPVVVTGGAGFIGSHLLERLARDGVEAICLDNFDDFYSPEVKRANIAPLLEKKAISLIEADICDAQAVGDCLKRFRPEAIVHLAARPGVRQSVQVPLVYERINAFGTLTLLEEARKAGISKFLFASSSSVYGGSEKVPFSEEDTCDRPLSPYAASKKSAEAYAYSFHHLYGMRLTVLRIFTAYGPRQRPEMAIHKFARGIMEGKEVPVFGDGSSGRDYTYVDDVVEGIVSALDKGFDFEVINLGDSRVVLLRDLIRLLEEALGKKARIRREEQSSADPPLTYADIEKARRLLGYRPRVSIEEGIGKFVEWLRKNPR